MVVYLFELTLSSIRNNVSEHMYRRIIKVTNTIIMKHSAAKIER